MTVFLVFLAVLLLASGALLMADGTKKQGWARNRALRVENAALHALLNEVMSEARTQLTAGVPEFGYTAQLIAESGLTTTHKELPR